MGEYVEIKEEFQKIGQKAADSQKNLLDQARRASMASIL
jgi:hypothetical protein